MLAHVLVLIAPQTVFVFNSRTSRFVSDQKNCHMLLVSCSANHRTQEIAESIQAKLDEYKTENKDLGRNQGVSELIILDRGFDITSPLLHELTYQVIGSYIGDNNVYRIRKLISFVSE